MSFFAFLQWGGGVRVEAVGSRVWWVYWWWGGVGDPRVVGWGSKGGSSRNGVGVRDMVGLEVWGGGV